MSSWGPVEVTFHGDQELVKKIVESLLDESLIVTQYGKNDFSKEIREFKFVDNKISYITNHGNSDIGKWETIFPFYPELEAFLTWSGEGESAAAYFANGELKTYTEGCWGDEWKTYPEEGIQYPENYPFKETIESFRDEIEEWHRKLSADCDMRFELYKKERSIVQILEDCILKDDVTCNVSELRSLVQERDEIAAFLGESQINKECPLQEIATWAKFLYDMKHLAEASETMGV